MKVGEAVNDATTDTLDVYDMTVEDIKAGPKTPDKATEETVLSKDTPEGDTDSTKKPEPPKPADAEELKRLQETLSKLESRLTEKDRFIGRRNDELGKLRKQITKLHEAMGLEPDADPEEALKEKQEQEAEKREQDFEVYKTEMKSWMTKTHPKFDEMLPTFEEMLKEDKVPDETIAAFKSDPYRFPADTLVSLVKRGELKSQLEELKKQNEELKQKLTGLPSKLANAAKASPPKSSPVTSADVDDDYDVFDMTPADLKARLKRAKA